MTREQLLAEYDRYVIDTRAIVEEKGDKILEAMSSAQIEAADTEGAKPKLNIGLAWIFDLSKHPYQWKPRLSVATRITVEAEPRSVRDENEQELPGLEGDGIESVGINAYGPSGEKTASVTIRPGDAARALRLLERKTSA